MKIGRAAAKTGLTVKAIRHYESLGLLRRLDRSGAFRDLTQADVERLHLVAKCKGLGFGLDEIKTIVELVDEAAPNCPDAEAMLALVKARQRQVAGQIALLTDLKERLREAETYLDHRLVETG